MTGAASGIGLAIAERFAAEGALVGLNDVDPDAAGRAARTVSVDRPGRVTALPFDVTDSEAVDAGIDRFAATHGGVDVLVNNAGWAAPGKPDLLERIQALKSRSTSGEEPLPLQVVTRMTNDEWTRSINVILNGTFYCTRAVLRHMELARSGSIINISSIAAYTATSISPEYGAAKAAVVSFTRSVGHEVAPLGIRINSVAPGTIDTTFHDRLGSVVQTFQTEASGRMGTVYEVAEVVLFLASTAASYCFGEVFTVSGGRH